MSKVAVMALAASAALAGCVAPPVHRVKVDAEAVRGAQRVSANPCGFRLRDVVDARTEGTDGGGLGLNQLKMEEAPALVRSELLKAGLLPPESPQGRDVVVTLRRIYLTQNRYTKIPVVVYSVKADGLADFLVRAQPAGMNWGSGEGEAIAAVSRAVHLANEQLMGSLDKSCHDRG